MQSTPESSNELTLHYVTKANSLVQLNRFIGEEKGKSLKLLEAKLLAFAISLIDQDAEELLPVRFVINDFWRRCNKIPDGSKYKKMVMAALKAISDKSGWVEIVNPSTGTVKTSLVRFFTKATLLDDGKTYEIVWDPDMKPALLHLKGNYLKYLLDDALQLNSEYSFALYELFISYEYLNQPLRFSLQELAVLLDATHFNRPSIIKAKAIDKAIADINTYSQVLRVSVEYSEENNIQYVTFYISRISGNNLSAGPEVTSDPSDNEITMTVKENINFEGICKKITAGEIDYTLKSVNLILDIITDVLVDTKKTYSINQSRITGGKVAAAFHELRENHILFVLDNLQNCCSDIRNPRAYIRAMLYNAATTMDVILESKRSNNAEKNKPPKERELDEDEIAAIRRSLAEDI